MNNLPFELLDSILLKSYVKFVVKEKQALVNKDSHVISQLASVDFCWFQRIRRRKFSKEVWRCLVEYYRKEEKATSIHRNNRQYLEENIQWEGLVNRLKFMDCITDVQAASLYRQNLALGKKGSHKRFRDLTSDVVKKTEAIQSPFRECLRDTKQYLIREILEDGGALKKAEFKFREAETSVKTPGQNFQLLEAINEIRDQMKARSHENELKSKLQPDDLEIFSAGQDGDVIKVWIWGKTEYALEKLWTLHKSNHIVDVFTELAKKLQFPSVERTAAIAKAKVNIDFEQFEKAVDFFLIVATFTSMLDIERKESEYETSNLRMIEGEIKRVYGVTKLRNKIYVLLLLRSSAQKRCCEIFVFEDQNTFRCQNRIKIEEIKEPRNIASNERENSLYVLEPTSRCVWKIKEEGDENEKKKKWLELGGHCEMLETLSVNRDGQLLLVGRRKNDSYWSLWIFKEEESEKSVSRSSISLPEDIQRPCQAVETSKGSFILLHKIKKRKENISGSDRASKNRKMDDGMEEEMKQKMEKEIDVKEEVTEKMEEDTWVLSEVSRKGETLCRFIPKNEEHKEFLESATYLAVDFSDRVFLADTSNHRIILLKSDLQPNRILIPKEEEDKEGRRILQPMRLFYCKEKKQLIVGGNKVFVYTLSRKLKQSLIL